MIPAYKGNHLIAIRNLKTDLQTILILLLNGDESLINMGRYNRRLYSPGEIIHHRESSLKPSDYV